MISPPSSPAARRREWRAVFILVIACLVAVVVLRGVSAGKDSAGGPGPTRVPTPVKTTGLACGDWATYWMHESGVAASVEHLEGMSNCRQATDGSWFVPRGSSDSRLPDGPLLTDEARSETAALRTELLAQISDLRSLFPQGLQRQLSAARGIYSTTVRPVTGHIKDGVMISAERGRYSRLIQAFMMAPSNQELARYVGWLMERRIEAFETFKAQCDGVDELEYLRAACNGLGDSLSIYFPPFPWDLTDPINLDDYLAWRFESGNTDPWTPTPAASLAMPSRGENA